MEVGAGWGPGDRRGWSVEEERGEKGESGGYGKATAKRRKKK